MALRILAIVSARSFDRDAPVTVTDLDGGSPLLPAHLSPSEVLHGDFSELQQDQVTEQQARPYRCIFDPLDPKLV
jgi:hypothetical protein